MADKINKSDLFGNINLEAEIAALKELLGLVTKLQEESKKMAKNKLSEVMKIDASTADGVKKLMNVKEQANQIEKQSNELDKEAIKLKKQLKESEDEQVKAKIKYQEATKKQKQELKDELILSDQSAGTLQKLAARSRQLRREREGLNLETEKGRARLKAINLELDKNNKKLIQNSDSLKKQKLNVGNYTKSVSEGIQASGLFSRELIVLQRIQATLAAFQKKTTAETEAQAVATKGAAAASGKFSKALRILKVALISTGIGAIVVALGTLIAAFASTQRGVDAFTKVLRPMSALFDKFVGFLQQTAFKAFDRLKEAFTDPKQAVIDLASAIGNNLLNRFKAIGVFGEAIAKLFQGDFKEGFEGMADAAVQLSTGVEGATDKLATFAKETGEFVSESIEQGAELDRLIKEFERRQIESLIPIKEARIEFEKLRGIANDQTKTDAERIDALEEAEKKQRFIIETEQSLLDLRIKRMELEQSFNDTTREEELELERLRVERLNFEEAAQKKINSLTSLRSGIEKRSAKEDEKRKQENLKTFTDNLNSELKAQKTHNEKLLADKRDHEEDVRKEDDKTAKNKEKISKKEVETAKAVFSEAKKIFDASLDKKQEILATELQDSKKQEDELTALAQNRVLFADESLAAEKAKQAEVQRELQKTEKRRQLLKATETAFDLLGSYAEGGSKTPFRDAFGDITKMLGALKSVQFFADGTESVEGGIEGKDSVPAMLMPKERVVDVANNLKIGGMTNNQLADLAYKYRTGGLMDDIPQIKVEQKRFETNKELINRVKDVEKAIKNIPEVSIDPHALANFITETIRRQNKVDRKHYKTNEIFK